MNALLIAVPLAPLLSALLIVISGRRLQKMSGVVAACGCAISLLALLLLTGSKPEVSAVWIRTGGFTLNIALHLDGLSLFMGLLASGIGFLVTIYSLEYMEKSLPRFFAISSFFIGAMLLLVLANSLLLLFAAWEGVGLASFLLIGFWYREESARRAAQKAFLVTRLGDMGFLLAFLLVLNWLATTNIETLLSAVEVGSKPAVGLALLASLFFAAAIGKSAQLPLTSWLPDAMAGPTPVSALIHSATMVAAGVYLVLRLLPLFEAAPEVLEIVLWIGGITALTAALVATVQRDIKRLLAWSTISQLGEMMFALGLGGALAASFHLATHAVFKSTLFLAAGAITHCSGSRDLDKLGRLRKAIPITAVVFVASALTLAGVPPFSGFWSEEAILADATASGFVPGVLMITLIFLAGVYISRATTAAFLSWPGAPAPPACDPGKFMLAPMLLLTVAALGLGGLLKGHLATLLGFHAAHELNWLWRGAAIFASIIGLTFGAWRVRSKGPAPALAKFPQTIPGFLDVLTRAPARGAFYLSLLFMKIESGLDRLAGTLGRFVLKLSDFNDKAENNFDRLAHWLAKSTLVLAHETGIAEDKGISYAVDRLAGTFGRTGGVLRHLQTGKIYLYTLVLFVWIIFTGVVVGLVWF